ncbi:MAG: CHASE domain-containing protein [Candidatus Omnitrophota bacterium]
MREFLVSQMDYIFFIYGLAFIFLSSVCIVLHRRHQSQIPWNWLGFFGLIHGVNEWLDMLALSLGDSDLFQWVRLVMMAASFICLLEFGRITGGCLKYIRIGRWIYIPLSLAIVLAVPAGLPGVNVVVRYSFGFIGGLLSALGLWRISRETRDGAWSIAAAAAAMAVYAVASGLIPSKAGELLAGMINQDTFLQFAGFPVQMVCVLAVSVVGVMIWYYNEEFCVEQSDPQMARHVRFSTVKAILVIAGVLLAGWLLTEQQGKKEAVVQRAALLSDAQQAAAVVEPGLVQSLSATAADAGSLAYQLLKSRLQHVRSVMPSVRFIYFMRKVDEKIVFIADSEPAGSQDESPPGQAYDEASPGIYEVFRSGQGLVEKPTIDRWGNWVSAYTPFNDGRTGELIAILGVDQDAGQFNLAVALGRLKVIMPTGIICFGILFVLAYWRIFLVALGNDKEGGRLGFWVRYGMAAIVMGMGLSLTLLLFCELRHNAASALRTTFLQHAIARAQGISQELSRQMDRLDGVRRLMAAQKFVDRAGFSLYVEPLLRDVPIRAFEWVPRVNREARTACESLARQDGFKGYQIHEKNAAGESVAAQGRDEYFPVYYLNPLNGDESALGFDLASEPVRREAMNKSRDMGIPVATPPLELVQQGHKKTGVLVFSSVYARDLPGRTREQRRKSLKGFVLAVYDADDFLKGVYRRMPSEGLACLIEDLAAPAGGRVLYRHEAGDEAVDWDHSALKYVMSLEIPDRHWRVTIVPGVSFMERHYSYAFWWVVPAGIFLTALLAAFLNFMMTARYRAEKLVRQRTAELKQSEESYHSQFLDNSAPMFLLDPVSCDILEANRAAERFYGYSDREFKNMRITAINMQVTDDIRRDMDKIMTNTERRFELKHCLKDGAVKDVEVFASRIFFKDRMIVHAIMHDITERKLSERLVLEARELLEDKVRERTEALNTANLELQVEIGEHEAAIQALEAANKKSEEASRLKSQFVATVSHEMRTPLNGIIGFAELIESLRDPARIKDMARTIICQSEILLALINDILDRAKIEAGKLLLNWEAVDIRELVGRLSQSFAPRLTATEVALVVTMADDVPHFFMTDPLRLGQVITNLVSNAIKFTQQGTVNLKVEKVSHDGGGVVLRFSVIDTGVGIPADKQHLIFERFAQVDGDLSRRFGGAGLGVSIAKGLVELMGGEIAFESREGVGTTFWFTLAVEPVEAPPISVEKPVIAAAAPDDRGRVLVAEDYLPNQEVVRMHLEGSGYDVTVVGDGKAALEVCGQEEFQFILMDIQMPGMDGYEATGKLRERGGWLKEVPILGFTANADNKTLEECLAIGMNGVIVKPVRKESFLAEIRQWFHLRRPQVPEGAAAPRLSGAQDGIMDYDGAIKEFGGKEKLLHEVVQRFLCQAKQQAVTMEAALNMKDAAAIGREAHKIKGAAANLTAMRLSVKAKDLEEKGKGNDLSGMAVLLIEFRKELEELEKYVKNGYRNEA